MNHLVYLVVIDVNDVIESLNVRNTGDNVRDNGQALLLQNYRCWKNITSDVVVVFRSLKQCYILFIST